MTVARVFRGAAVGLSLPLAAATPLRAQRVAPAAVQHDSGGHTPPPDAWLGGDKVKHAFVSGFTYAASYAGARTVGASRRSGLAVAVLPTAIVAVGKEVRDRRANGRFSVRDLAADAIGAIGYALVVARTSR